jgi:hypothetical protein
MGANEKQVGGQHYKIEGEQHWDRIYRLYGPGYFIGCATKYLERYHLKNGQQDLDKAIHYIEKLKELEYSKPVPASVVVRGNVNPIHDCTHEVSCTCIDCCIEAHKE